LNLDVSWVAACGPDQFVEIRDGRGAFGGPQRVLDGK
jgi:hypothetical protein